MPLDRDDTAAVGGHGRRALPTRGVLPFGLSVVGHQGVGQLGVCGGGEVDDGVGGWPSSLSPQ